MIVEVPKPEFGDDGVLFFADCGVVPEPTVSQLAAIGVQTGLLARQVFGRRPRIAFLSFSTHGSSSHPAVSKMAAAAVQARQLALQTGGSEGLDEMMEMDGELQADTAIVPAIARIKRPNSMAAGRANVLIFPDLNSGNIAAKLVHHLSRCQGIRTDCPRSDAACRRTLPGHIQRGYSRGRSYYRPPSH